MSPGSGQTEPSKGRRYLGAYDVTLSGFVMCRMASEESFVGWEELAGGRGSTVSTIEVEKAVGEWTDEDENCWDAFSVHQSSR